MSEPAIVSDCSTRDLLAPAAPIDVLELRAWARAYLWAIGEYELAEAVDTLQDFAERSGLVNEIGVAAVQQILADAFAPYREGAS